MAESSLLATFVIVGLFVAVCVRRLVQALCVVNPHRTPEGL